MKSYPQMILMKNFSAAANRFSKICFILNLELEPLHIFIYFVCIASNHVNN